MTTRCRTFLGVLLALSYGCSSSSDENSDDSAASGGSHAATAGSTGGSVSSGGSVVGPAGAGDGAGQSTTGGSGGSAAASASAGTAGTGGSGGGTTPVVLPCDSLSEVGVWEDITPDGADPSTYDGYGVSSLAVDPINAGTVYIGNSPNGGEVGIYKSSDCGATWLHVNIGTNGAKCGWDLVDCSTVLDHGRQWSFEIDPVDSNVLYTNNGYGSYDNGLMKSTNGGVDWVQSWPQCLDPADCWNSKDPVTNALAPGFLGDVVLDPYDHNHVLIDFHADCTNETFCVGESTDAGVTWTVVDGDPAMESAHESRLGFLDDSSTWVFIAGATWRTSDAGKSWSKVSDGSGGGMLYHASNGAYYLGGGNAIHRSTDNGQSWTALADSGQIVQGLIGDGKTIYSSSFAAGFKWGDDLQPYFTTAEDDGITWAPYSSPGMNQGAIQLGLDKSHHVLYSANGSQGFWRVKTE